MKVIKATELARTLGMSRYTMRDICRNDPKLAFKRGRDYWVRISELAKRPGMDIIEAILAPNSGKWVKAVDLAKMAGLPRRTIAYWCKNRPHFARRIGRLWYLSTDVLGVTPDQAEFLAKWAPSQQTAVRAAQFLGDLSRNAHEEDEDE